jgi:hypothetical protein
LRGEHGGALADLAQGNTSSLTGAKGDPGIPGAAGAAGADGADGADGPTGPQGPAGPQGNMGATGAPGTPGADGADGADGVPGSNSVSTTSIIDGAVTGVKIANDTITATQIAVNAVGPSELTASGVTAGNYTSPDLTVDADGRITAASNNTASVPTSDVSASNTEIVINDAGAAKDFRVEGSSDEELLFVDQDGSFLGHPSIGTICENAAGYAGIVAHNTSSTSLGSVLHAATNDSNDPTTKISLVASLQVQTVGGSPRSAWTYQNFSAASTNSTQATSNLILNGGHFTGYSTFDLSSHVNSNGNMELGSSASPWKEVFAVDGSINTSDIRLKRDVLDIEEAEKAVALKAKSLLKKFRWKDSFEVKGEDARIHFGIMAQELMEAFDSEGLDPMRYSMICYTEWWQDPEDPTKQSDEEVEGYVRKDVYCVRYSELLAFIIAAI